MDLEAIDEVFDEDFYLDVVHWCLENNLWDGRKVEKGEICQFLTDLQEKVDHFFLYSENSPYFQNTLNRPQNLSSWRFADLRDEMSQAQIEKAGLKKFWKKHKKAILITSAVVAAVAGVTIVSVCLAAASQADSPSPSAPPPEPKAPPQKPKKKNSDSQEKPEEKKEVPEKSLSLEKDTTFPFPKPSENRKETQAFDQKQLEEIQRKFQDDRIKMEIDLKLRKRERERLGIKLTKKNRK